MSQDRSASSAGNGEIEPESWRATVLAFAVAAGGVCLGGAAAIVAINAGASALVSLSLMAAFVIGGVVTGVLLSRRARGSVGQAPDPETLLEWQLSARYGVRVERVAWHVWRVDGELVEATLDPATGYLTSGGRELQL
jgi:hypothetical protein